MHDPKRPWLRLARAALLILPFVPGGALGSPEDEAALAHGLRGSRSILGLEYFAEQARLAHPGRLVDARLRYEASHQRHVYEVFILDLRGEVWEVEFDASTGLLIEREKKGP
jgi:uncharacterized membrane protein YkoI